jgi:hypothetical protein
MSQADEQEEEQLDEPAPPPRTGPVVRPMYVVVLLALVLGIGGLAVTGPVCNMKEPGRDIKDLTRQEIKEQAVNRFKDLRTVVTFADTTRVLLKPSPIDPTSPGLVVNTVLTVKKVGDTSEVVTHHAGRGFIAYKLRLPDGACGYVFSSDRISVVSP